MKVFKFVEDKDVFQKFYSQMLARRLVSNNSISEDAECSMITLLRNACGVEYTSKLQRMFQDVSSSRDLNARFGEWLKNKREERRDQPESLSSKFISYQIFMLLTVRNPYFGLELILVGTQRRIGWTTTHFHACVSSGFQPVN